MKKLKYEYVYEFFNQKGCILLSDSYKGSSHKLEYICSCGNKDFVYWGNFSRYGRCKKCSAISGGKKKKFSQEFVENYFYENDCQLLDKYVDANTPLKYKCSCGDIDRIRFSKFKQGQRCRSCKYKKISEKGKQRIGSKNPRWNPDREYVALNKTIHIKFNSMISYFLSESKVRKDCKSEDFVGYTRKELKEHIINHPDWGKVKDKKWSIDHIFPVKAFLDHQILDPKIIHSLDNLRPMLLQLNIQKSGKYCKDKFKIWLLKKGIDLNGYHTHQRKSKKML